MQNILWTEQSRSSITACFHIYILGTFKQNGTNEDREPTSYSFVRQNRGTLSIMETDARSPD